MKFDVEFENVSFNYKKFAALKDISFSLKQERIYGLIGRNGAGKTTLLSLLASFQEPKTGQVKVGGKNPFENREVMANINFIYQSDYSEEYEPSVEYFKYAKRYRANFDLDYAHNLAEKFALPLKKPINKLSSGMQSALNATLGLASRTPITIFDEVYVGMDAPTREIFYREVLAEQERYPRIMILSTHLVSEMDYLFDHVLILDKGQLLIDEPFDEIINRGVTIIGNAPDVDTFVADKTILHTEQLGNTKSVMVYGTISEVDRLNGEKQGLTIGPVSLQELFIHLTEGGVK